MINQKGGRVMPTYIGLMNLTEQGIKNIKDAPKRLEEAVKALESMGGKLIAFYLVMGEYDYVGIAEAPSDEVAATFMLGLGAEGSVRTTTMRAFTKEQLAGMISKLP
jgi:uncharacterized protein with GYD domain